ncbi:MAG: hypothetical protein ACOYMM_08760 [Phycisphaerales bacterium]|jgi:hypothetical protein
MTDTQPRRGGLIRKVLIAVALLLVVLVVGGVLFLDSIVKAGIATAGTHVLGVKTTVEDVSIGLVSGETAIRGLAVDNPQGYAPVKFLALGAVEVDAPISGLTGEKIVIERLVLRDLTIDVEKGADGKLNVERIVENLKKATGADKPADQTQPQPAPPAGESKEALVRELRLEAITVNLRNIAGGKDGVVEVKLPDLVLRDLSSKGGVDVLASEVSGVVIGAVMKSVIAANIEGIGSDVLGGMQGAVEGIGGVIGGSLRGAVDVGVAGAGAALDAVGKGLGDIGKGAGKLMEGAGGALKDGVKGVGDALEGVFGGKK